MCEKAYVIGVTYGEYDDFTHIPMFVCYMKMEAELFLDALENREEPYWGQVVNYFTSYGADYVVPEDIGFNLTEVDVLTLCERHHNAI